MFVNNFGRVGVSKNNFQLTSRLLAFRKKLQWRSAQMPKCFADLSTLSLLQMTQALGFLQGCGVVVRDLRLEHWKLSSVGVFPALKLHGLSHATRWNRREGRLNAACGMLAYTSPGGKIDS